MTSASTALGAARRGRQLAKGLVGRLVGLLPPWLQQNLNLVRVLALAQLRERYLGTWAGIIWAFVHPMVLIAIFWIVFAQGFKMPTSGDRPFLLLLICGIVPWMAFVDAVIGGAGAIVGRAYLVRKIAFPLELLPVTQVVASMIVHLPMLLLAFCIVLFYGRLPGWSILMLPVYLSGLVLISMGLALLLSALSVAFRDVQQGLGVITNILFWATPIVWSQDMLPAGYRWLFAANPITYLVEGYRHALVGDSAPPPSMTMTLLFWGFTIMMLFLGTWVFRRLKSSFVDML